MKINDSYDETEVAGTIAHALEAFYSALIKKIDSIDLKEILSSKNPYLYRAKSMQSAHDIVHAIIQAFVSSSEETIFGSTFFEPVAVAASGGSKSAAEGIDIDIDDKEHSRKYAIAVKSGTSVFNADSRKRQEENFKSAQKRARQAGLDLQAVVGYAYGTKKDSGRGSAKLYEELAGEDFWTAISGDPLFYKKIISFMGNYPEQYVNTYKQSYTRAENRLIRDFSMNFCRDDGSIDWNKLIEFNSGSPDRKEREERCREILVVYDFLKNDPGTTKKRMSEYLSLSAARLNRDLDWLSRHGIIIKGHEGKKTGWTVLDSTFDLKPDDLKD